MGLRERRLAADARFVEGMLEAGGPIRILERSGDPPDRYRLEYDVPGLTVQNGAVVPAGKHLVEVYLTLAYPRQAPQCRMLTPVFHPNIAPHAICIGDHWSAGESLSAMLVRIAEMICFQSYNVKSPLNGDAARWADAHAAELPLSRVDYSKWVQDAAARAAAAPAAVPPPLPPPIPVPEISGAGASFDRVADGPVVTVATTVSSHESDERTLECAACGASLTLPAGWKGAWARCPMCGRMLSAATESPERAG